MDDIIMQETHRVKFYECDYNKRMKISTMLRITAELAGDDYTNKGLGHEVLWEQGFAFLLSRISLNIMKYPMNHDLLNALTWENGKKGASFIRGYDIAMPSGEVCINGISGWILINPHTRHILKPSEFPHSFPQRMDRITSAKPIGRIASKDASFIGSHIVTISDIDANGHVYNANYADIAQNFMTTQEFEKDVENFQINFVCEAKLGEKIDIYKDTNDKRAIIVGKVEEKTCFESEFIW